MRVIAFALGLAVALVGCSKQEAPAPAPAAAPSPAPVTAPIVQTSTPLSPELAALLVRDHSPVLGPPQAPVTIVEFLDPACEACAAYAPVVRQIEFTYPQEVRVVVRFAAFHPGSEDAIRILDAARRQGKFEPVLDALFDRQQEWASHHAPKLDQAWQIAADAGVDVAKAKRTARDKQADAVLNQEAKDVISLKVERTPTFFVNGKPLDRYGPEELADFVRQEVQRAKIAQR